MTTSKLMLLFYKASSKIKHHFTIHQAKLQLPRRLRPVFDKQDKSFYPQT